MSCLVVRQTSHVQMIHASLTSGQQLSRILVWYSDNRHMIRWFILPWLLDNICSSVLIWYSDNHHMFWWFNILWLLDNTCQRIFLQPSHDQMVHIPLTSGQQLSKNTPMWYSDTLHMFRRFILPWLLDNNCPRILLYGIQTTFTCSDGSYYLYFWTTIINEYSYLVLGQPSNVQIVHTSLTSGQ